ncbi:carbohydrate kinase family protein [Candidatus Saccharibacteria bacterium]|nr:carbohydrate kinase family protein [Candidatus Saccharibacteria bacterium]
MSKILSLGSALQDIYLIDHDDLIGTEVHSVRDGKKTIFGDLIFGSKVDIDKMSFEIGGGGTNSAVTFARHGHESVFIGNVGRDIAAQAIMNCLDEEGIDSSYVKVLPRKTTGTSVVLLDSKSGERTILTCRGASAEFSNLDDAVLEEIRPDWLYITSLRGDLETLTRFVKRAKKLGAKIMFNPGVLELKRAKKLLNLLPELDAILLNRREAMALVPGVTLEELLEKLARYVKIVLITDGQMGAIATDGLDIYRFAIYEDFKVKDTTGAGDAFGSGFLAHYAAGKSFRQSLIFASANSSYVVTQLGAKRGILTGAEKLHPMPIQKLN